MFERIKKIFKSSDDVDSFLLHPEGKRFYRENHSLRRELMDQDALKIINRLSKNGFRAYLVGGCVRDMLLERRPKDFDIVTNASPTQIRSLFANSRTIGRRFKIVHILFKGKTIEVSTFRSVPQHRLTKNNANMDLLLKRDNEYGTPKEDVARRDFTFNALFFDPRNDSIIDYVGGLNDIKNRRLMVIGDPDISFREDPVRMLRAAKFSALLDFNMDSRCIKAIKRNRHEISRASTSRLLEEYIKIFRTGKTAIIFNSMAKTELLKTLFPESINASEAPSRTADFSESSLGRRLTVADRMLSEREDLTVNIYFSLFLADLVKDIFSNSRSGDVIDYIKSSIFPACRRLNIPGKDRNRLLQIFASQNRFNRTNLPKNKQELFRKKVYFFESFMLYKIIAISNNDDQATQNAMYWEIGLRTHPPEGCKTISLFDNRRSGQKRNRRRDGKSKREDKNQSSSRN